MINEPRQRRTTFQHSDRHARLYEPRLNKYVRFWGYSES